MDAADSKCKGAKRGKTRRNHAHAISAQERKQGLFSKALRIADKAADRMEDQIGSANISQATIAFGVSTEKALLLAGEPIHQLNVSFGVPNIMEEFKAVCDQIRKASAQLPSVPEIEAQVVESTAVAGDGVAGMGLRGVPASE